MKIVPNEIIKIINQEIIWCKKSKKAIYDIGDTVWYDGFIKGLKQSQILIRKMIKK